MNQHPQWNFGSQSSLPIWEYISILLQLEGAYCLCQLPSEAFPSLDDYCTSHDHILPLKQEVDSLRYAKNLEEQPKRDTLKNTKSSNKHLKDPGSITQTDPQESQVEEEHSEITAEERLISTRIRRSSRFNIRARLVRIRNRILKDLTISFSSSSKKTREATGANLSRRSQYIGVSRNNSNWQALINVKNTKKYIGTFGDELEAAKTYDIYAVAMRREKALLNFSYTAQEMLTSIDHFLEHGSVIMYA